MIEVQEISWKIMHHELSCFCCPKPATHRATIRHNGATIKVCLCPDCLKLTDSEIVARALPRESIYKERIL